MGSEWECGIGSGGYGRVRDGGVGKEEYLYTFQTFFEYLEFFRVFKFLKIFVIAGVARLGNVCKGEDVSSSCLQIDETSVWAL